MDKNKVEDNVNKEQPKVDIEQPKVNKPTHRYVCEACTGVGFYGNKGGTHPSNCQTCGAGLGTVKPENFIKL